MTIPAASNLTRILIVVAVVVGVAWDVWVEVYAGNDASISVIIRDASVHEPIIAFALGVCAGHWFWPQTPAPAKVDP